MADEKLELALKMVAETNDLDDAAFEKRMQRFKKAFAVLVEADEAHKSKHKAQWLEAAKNL